MVIMISFHRNIYTYTYLINKICIFNFLLESRHFIIWFNINRTAPSPSVSA